jgi:CheY-like chemotaxis protein/nitrogen-specific signal transduction histidine kinase
MPITTPGAPYAADGDHDALIEQNAILCSANQHLLLATFDAEDLRAQAEAAILRQNEFLAMLAHELRNPLAPISMASVMLGKMPGPSSELLHIKTIIDRQVGQLSRLLDDLLDTARISSGKIALQQQPLLVAEQLAHAVDTVQARMHERSQQLLIEAPEESLWISGDAVRLAQVFSNLLVNASKFTPAGGRIVVRTIVVGNDVVITVEDNGDGIAEDVLPTIFTLFAQGPRTLARSQGGLGIGLNIVRNVIDMHGGSVSAASPGVGHGTTFTVTLPLLEMPDVPVHAPRNDVPPALRHHILLVEDNVDASDMLKMLLCSENHTVVTAYDGVAGLALACAGAFDIVLCDIGLPGISGFDLVQTVRATLGDAAPYCIAVSGYGRLEDRTRALASGFHEHLVKPVDIDHLVQLIASVPCKTAHAR